MQPQDIINYAKKENVDLSNDETMIIYKFIKKHYNELLNKDTKSFSILKEALSPKLYEKILSLYNYYKNYL